MVSKHPCAVFDLSQSQARGQYPFDVTWPGVLKMITNLTDDKSLPLYVRNSSERILWERFEKGLFESGVSYLSRGCSADAKKVAALLRDQFGQRTRYIALSSLIGVHQHVPFARLAFDYMVACRRYLRTKRIQGKQKKYREIRTLVATGVVEDR